jgi:hypothetical protein
VTCVAPSLGAEWRLGGDTAVIARQGAVKGRKLETRLFRSDAVLMIS